MLMKKMRDYIVKGKKVFVGLEDSKRSWKVCVRSEHMVVHETSMPTEYEGLHRYLKRNYPGCTIRVIYEAGFGGFWLHDQLEGDGIDCIVTPPNKVTQEKDSRVKNDRNNYGDWRRCLRMRITSRAMFRTVSFGRAVR